MKKKIIVTAIAVHPYQAEIIKNLQSGNINLQNDSLRDIGKKCGIAKDSPQLIKHHLEALVKLGVLQIIKGEYAYLKINVDYDSMLKRIVAAHEQIDKLYYGK